MIDSLTTAVSIISSLSTGTYAVSADNTIGKIIYDSPNKITIPQNLNSVYTSDYIVNLSKYYK